MSNSSPNLKSSYSLLLVEDNPGDARLLREMLGEDSHKTTVIHVDDMRAAEQYLAEHTVDIILLDLGLPDASGLDAVQRAQYAAPGVPLVVLTGFDDESLAAQALQAGAQDYLIKGQIEVQALPRALRYAIERNIAEMALRHSEQQYRQLVHGLAAAIYTTNADGHITLFNRAAADLWGREPALGRDQWCGALQMYTLDGKLIPPSQWPLALALREGKVVRDQEYILERADGSRRHILPHPALLYDPAGTVTGAVNLMLDITERKQAEDKIRRLNRLYAVLSGINTLIVRVDNRDELFKEACRIAVAEGKFSKAWIATVQPISKHLVLAANHGFETHRLQAMIDYLNEDIQLGQSLPLRAINERAPAIANNLRDDAAGQQRDVLIAADAHAMAALPLVVRGAAVGVMLLHAAESDFFDADEMKLLTELAGDIAFAIDNLEKTARAEHLLFNDQLTGLPNRRLFTDRLEQMLGAAADDKPHVAVLCININRFAMINESFGREAGDILLQELTARLNENFASFGTVARLTGDGFAVAIAGLWDSTSIARGQEKYYPALFEAPFLIEGQELRITGTVGLAFAPADGNTATLLIANAEAALKRAKARSVSMLLYNALMNSRVTHTLELESQLRTALKRQEFVLHYQPKVDLEGRRIIGAEALIRWQSPERGLVPPLDFIPLMEETGMIIEMGAWALAKASADHLRWLQMGLAAPRIAVNVSAIQLRAADFVNTVKTALAHGANPPMIDLEITESIVMEDIDGSIQKLKAIRALGVNIAIDDFGTGYSSLAYLTKLPVQTLKIDRSFIITMLDDPDTMALVQTIFSLSHSLRLTVVAEGVDSEEQAKMLRLLRCDEMQGYLFSKPVPFDAFTLLLQQDDKALSAARSQIFIDLAAS